MNEERIHQVIAEELDIRPVQVQASVQLLAEGNTVPFIARYRKERTGELDEEQLRAIEERYRYLQQLQQRKEEVIRLIEEQGKLTEELRSRIEEAVKLQEVEDLYRPYRPKRKTRASVAREKGLGSPGGAGDEIPGCVGGGGGRPPLCERGEGRGLAGRGADRGPGYRGGNRRR